MNININFKIPILNTSSYISFNENILLSPFYVTEKELLSVYLTEYTDEQLKLAREVIFYNSIEADNLFRNVLESLTPQEQFALKRRFTLCMSIISFGNKFNIDYVKSISRSKTLAEFSVSTSKTNDPYFVVNIIKEAKECVDTLKDIINRSGEGLIRTFVKGMLNSKNLDSNRLWHHFNLPFQSQEIHATKKKEFNGRYYKNGGNFY